MRLEFPGIPMRLKSSLEEIYAPIREGLDEIQEAILDILSTSNPLSREVIRYFFSSQGKYLRPALVLFGANFSPDRVLFKKAVPVAAAFEIFHSATLIHDDIVDSAYLRRNMPTVNVKWGAQVAVLVGDFLHDRALATFFAAQNDRVVSLFLNTACEVCDGEILEFTEKNNFNLKEELYFEIIQKKTASLLSACVETGAMLAGLPLEEALALKNYGLYLGMAFQIVDDCLDFCGEAHVFGKTLGSDCDAGVLTLPLIRLVSLVPEDKKSEVFQIFKSTLGEEKLSYLRNLIMEYGTIDYSLEKAKTFTDRARLELEVLKNSPARRSLEILLDYVLERSR
jgi:octaprenyl-diphosphate synthase